jgi:hypothetical protein
MLHDARGICDTSTIIMIVVVMLSLKESHRVNEEDHVLPSSSL